MADRDDLSLSLPDPPPPAPARREEAINLALQRFDGTEQAAPSVKGQRQPSRRLLVRSYLGTALAVSLVALIVAPTLWMRSERPHQGSKKAAVALSDKPLNADIAEGPRVQSKQVPAVEHVDPSKLAEPPLYRASPPSTKAEAEFQAAPASAAPSPPPPIAETSGFDRREAREAPPPAQLSMPSPVAPTAPPMSKAAAGRMAHNADETEILVTSARRNPARIDGRGDWNACTVNDPQPDLAACKQYVNPAGKGKSGLAAAHLADGLTLAWQGNTDAAIADFDKAIVAAPRSSFAYLNRGLAFQKRGDQDKALADLDKAVRYAPYAARTYYNRSILLRERGDVKRADADLQRAVDLDGRYRSRK